MRPDDLTLSWVTPTVFDAHSERAHLEKTSSGWKGARFLLKYRCLPVKYRMMQFLPQGCKVNPKYSESNLTTPSLLNTVLALQPVQKVRYIPEDHVAAWELWKLLLLSTMREDYHTYSQPWRRPEFKIPSMVLLNRYHFHAVINKVKKL